jgi:hypothetical protein
MDDKESMKATKTTRKYRYQKDAEKAAKHPRTYSYEKTSISKKKKYSYEKDLERLAKKGRKKLGVGIVLAILFLVVGVLGGFFTMKYAFKNDAFYMIAYEDEEIDITIGADEKYTKYYELGAKCISFGKNVSNEVEITYYYRADLSEDKVEVEKVDETKPGMYYAVYTTKAARYKTVTLIRNIYVMGVEDNG